PAIPCFPDDNLTLTSRPHDDGCCDKKNNKQDHSYRMKRQDIRELISSTDEFCERETIGQRVYEPHARDDSYKRCDDGRRKNSQHHSEKCQHSHGDFHRPPPFMSLAHFFTSRARQKCRPKRFHKTCSRQAAGKDKAGNRKNEDSFHETARRRNTDEKCLKGQPFARKTVKRRKSRYGQRSDKEKESRVGHEPDQSAVIFHMARSCFRNNNSGSQEKKRLKDCMIERMIEGGRKSEKGECFQSQRKKYETGAEPEQNDSDIFDTVIGEKTFQIML